MNKMKDSNTGDQRKSNKCQDVDSGFAWCVLIGCFIMFMFNGGSIKTFGVLHTEMVEYYSSGSGNTAVIGSIALFLESVLGPVANLLCKIYSFRLVTFIGGVLFGLGYFLSGFVTRMEYMYLTFLSTGIGYGLTFAPCLTILSYYFDKRRSLANGIMVSGGGVGVTVFPLLYKYLIEQYGLKGTFWIIGAFFTNVCVSACVFRQPRYLVEEKKENDRAQRSSCGEHKSSNGKTSCSQCCIKDDKRFCSAFDLRFSLFKNVSFTLYVVSFVCCFFAYLGSLLLIPANVKALGYDKTHVALSITIFGGVEIVTRILIGYFADLNIIKRKYIYANGLIIGGVVSFLAPLFENFTFIAVYSTVISTFVGTFFSLMSVLIIEVVGLKNFAPAFGLLTLCMVFGILPSQPIIGLLYDLYGTWNPSFILTGCIYIFAGVIVLLEPLAGRFCGTTRNKETGVAVIHQQQEYDNKAMDDSLSDSVV